MEKWQFKLMIGILILVFLCLCICAWILLFGNPLHPIIEF